MLQEATLSVELEVVPLEELEALEARVEQEGSAEQVELEALLLLLLLLPQQ
jgi:hypothetical protein